MAWVTDGRTIENYVPGELLWEAIAAVHPSLHFDNPLDDPYVCPLSFKFKGKSYGPDKIRVARYVAEHGYELSADLMKRVVKLVDQIRKANA